MAEIKELLDVMAQLRNPDGGCAWDLQQDFNSVAPYTLEEAYEVVDAIERSDMSGLCDELGDLLLQVVFHSRMAEEQQLFAFGDVVEAIVSKMIRRHPHVFGAADGTKPSYTNTNELNGAWETQKSLERASGDGESGKPASAIAGVALNLPALVRAEKIQKRAARVGFDWQEPAPVVEKIREEIDEVLDAMEQGDQTHIEDEMGDLLFAVVNLARHNKVDPEAALRAATSKFSNRFVAVEEKARERGISMRGQSLQVLDELWDAVKIEQSKNC